MKIAYLGFDLFYDCLEYLVENFNVIKIFTCDVDSAYEFNHKTYRIANDNNIPITIEPINEKAIVELEESGCDVIVSAGYYHKIPTSDKIKSVNIHPSLLPEGRGPWPLPVIILKDIKNSGVTAHRISKSFDAGEIVLSEKVSVSDDENLETLTQKMQSKAKELIIKLFDDFDRLWTLKKIQTGGSYWKEPTVKEMTFTRECSFEEIDRITRAFYGFKCFLKTSDGMIEIKKAVALNKNEIIKQSCIDILELSNCKLCIINYA